MGTWFIDSDGHNCFQWEGGEGPKCDAIVPEGDSLSSHPGGPGASPDQDPAGNPDNL